MDNLLNHFKNCFKDIDLIFKLDLQNKHSMRSANTDSHLLKPFVKTHKHWKKQNVYFILLMVYCYTISNLVLNFLNVLIE